MVFLVVTSVSSTGRAPEDRHRSLASQERGFVRVDGLVRVEGLGFRV